jgi:hypothetical protein
MKEKEHMEDLDVDGKIPLNRILKKEDLRTWI